ncbi:uncharacterized protein N7459_005864 [Penicillium hispanicum]|uniref:uncharacterized protein n=1 Tax=Penicillium hispanicum TaxID=1080232 RepID=UPI002540DF3D|nr:uncharacterized protein N7459_005864 [Penicillium hispanicum]KAJ5579879.1 hypothetical protein N7459_005864 [Penicillium hispanicum]
MAKFLDRGVNINYKSRWGRSALALAARGGHFDIVEPLAACEGHDAIADYLLRALRRRYPQLRGTARADVQLLLQYAAQRANEARVTYLLSKEVADPNFQFAIASWMPLCAAVKHAPPSMILLLLENGANPNADASPKKIGDLAQTVNTTPLATGY